MTEEKVNLFIEEETEIRYLHEAEEFLGKIKTAYSDFENTVESAESSQNCDESELGELNVLLDKLDDLIFKVSFKIDNRKYEDYDSEENTRDRLADIKYETSDYKCGLTDVLR